MSRPGYIRIANDIGGSEEAIAIPEEHYLAAIGLFVLALSYCDRQLTDGRIPAAALQRAVAPGVDHGDALAELEHVGLLARDGSGWIVPNYLKWQRSREQVEAASIAGSKAASTRWSNAEGNANRNANRNAEGNAKELAIQTTTESRAPARGPVDNSGKPRKREKETPPAYDLVAVVGPIGKIVGRDKLTEKPGHLFADGSDLNLACRRYLAAVDEWAEETLGDLTAEKREAAKVQCRRRAFELLAAIHANVPIKNPAAYLTAAAGNATCLGDLVGDDLVTSLRQPNSRKKKEPSC